MILQVHGSLNLPSNQGLAHVSLLWGFCCEGITIVDRWTVKRPNDTIKHHKSSSIYVLKYSCLVLVMDSEATPTCTFAPFENHSLGQFYGPSILPGSKVYEGTSFNTRNHCGYFYVVNTLPWLYFIWSFIFFKYRKYNPVCGVCFRVDGLSHLRWWLIIRLLYSVAHWSCYVRNSNYGAPWFIELQNNQGAPWLISKIELWSSIINYVALGFVPFGTPYNYAKQKQNFIPEKYLTTTFQFLPLHSTCTCLDWYASLCFEILLYDLFKAKSRLTTSCSTHCLQEFILFCYRQLSQIFEDCPGALIDDMGLRNRAKGTGCQQFD